jgi:hypothetical protein
MLMLRYPKPRKSCESSLGRSPATAAGRPSSLGHGTVLNLPTTISKILVGTGAAVASIAVHASFDDLGIVSRTVNPGAKNTLITTIATTVVVTPPPPTFDRNVKFLSILNTSSTPCAIIVQQTDGAKFITIFSILLQPGFLIQYDTDADGFRVYDALGRILLANS